MVCGGPREKEINDPDAMWLATVDADGLPDARMVLLKGSNGGLHLLHQLRERQGARDSAGLHEGRPVFHWKSLRRQVRVRGPVEMVSDAEADAYFEPSARQPDRRLGIETVAPARKPFRAGKGGRARRRGSASAKCRARPTGTAIA